MSQTPSLAAESTGSRRRATPTLLVSALALLLAPGCIVIPVGDLLKGPALTEQVLSVGAGIFSKEKIAIVDVSGVISGSEGATWLSYTPNAVSETVARIERARADDEVEAVVLRISSPGGEVTACDIIHREVARLREQADIPVVACIMEQGASGGYYIACAAESIVAHPTSVVGSIGVILQSFDLSGLLEKIGVSVDPVKSGAQKDLNSVFRSSTEEEREVLQQLVADFYARFLDVVEKGRPAMSREKIEAFADGRVVSGVEAARLGLVDRTGYLEDAILLAQEMAGIESPTIVRYTRRPQVGSNIYTQLEGPQPAGTELRVRLDTASPGTAKLYYLWKP